MNNSLKFYIRFLVVISILIIVGMPIDLHAALRGDAGIDLDLLEIGYAPDILAIAETAAAKQSSPFAGFYNPASLANILQRQFHSLHGQLIEGTEIFSVNGVLPIDNNLTMSLSWLQMQISDIPLVSTTDVGLNSDLEAEDYAAYHAHGLIAALAYSLSAKTAIGISSTLFYKNFTNVDLGKGYGFSLSPGIIHELNPNFSIGIYIKNLLSYAKWQTDYEESFGRWLNGGFGLKIGFLDILGEARQPLGHNGSLNLRLGVETNFYDVLYLRGGFSSTHVNAGLGLHYGVVMIDYAYIGNSLQRFSDSSRFSVGFRF